MQLSPLQLLEYSLAGVSIAPVEGYVADAEFDKGLVFFPGKLAISAQTSVELLNEEPSYSDFGIRLTLRVAPKTDKQCPYNLEITVVGSVRMHLTLPVDQAQERRSRAIVNGVSLLYGVVRELVSNITSRSVHGAMLLPSLSFADLATPVPTARPKVRAPVKRRNASDK